MVSIERQRGLGLVEVLLALLVLGIGMLALGRLTALALREIEIGRARAVAVQLAREKLEDLRSFAQLESGPAGIFGFDEIGSSDGGAETELGNLQLPAGGLEIDGLKFTREWTIRPFYLCDAETAATEEACIPGRRADLLWITMTLSWIDLSGAAGSVIVEAAIAAFEPALSSQALLRPSPVLAP
ncbi:prepilin-type N-terminal cleavage/methylation domain-containing protein [Hydrocarboniphaga effusa]|uniref:prepilin-type N-terminal cleavage/methylation domain-containing protein n=1 Tax=Hydrocarboniphaga effusa TaxID=243629 RepID=UPI00398C21B7